VFAFYQFPVAFLQKGVTLVLFVGQNALDRRLVLFRLSAGRAKVSPIPYGDWRWRTASTFKEHLINLPHRDRRRKDERNRIL
jgi:hypothetical protein